MKLLLALALTCAAGFAQQQVILSQAPASPAYSTINYYSGSNLIYVCKAPAYINPNIAAQVITVTGASNANPVSFTATAHGLGDYATYGATFVPTPAVIISGGTGNWTAINGVWIGTPTSANAFTIPVDSTAFGALAGTLVVTTTAPRWTKPVWSISKYMYDASSNFTGQLFPGNPGGVSATTPVGGSPAFAFTCSTRTSYSFQ